MEQGVEFQHPGKQQSLAYICSVASILQVKMSSLVTNPQPNAFFVSLFQAADLQEYRLAVFYLHLLAHRYA